MVAALNRFHDALNMVFQATVKNVLVSSCWSTVNASSQIVKNMEQQVAKDVEVPSLSNKVSVD